MAWAAGALAVLSFPVFAVNPRTPSCRVAGWAASPGSRGRPPPRLCLSVWHLEWEELMCPKTDGVLGGPKGYVHPQS